MRLMTGSVWWRRVSRRTVSFTPSMLRSTGCCAMAAPPPPQEGREDRRGRCKWFPPDAVPHGRRPPRSRPLMYATLPCTQGKSECFAAFFLFVEKRPVLAGLCHRERRECFDPRTDLHPSVPPVRAGNIAGGACAAYSGSDLSDPFSAVDAFAPGRPRNGPITRASLLPEPPWIKPVSSEF
jgi:hypothetical protein